MARWRCPSTRKSEPIDHSVPGERLDESASPREWAVRCEGVSVNFGAVRALHNVCLALEQGRIHALVGQNGAGKTTLARVLAGLQMPDIGEVHILGRPIQGGNVRAAQAAGLAMVHQHFSLPPSFSVAEALELTATKGGGAPIYRRRELERRWLAEVAGSCNVSSLSTRIRDLPVETRQSLEIVRALASDARVLLLDEPTALLTPSATDSLFDRLQILRDTGVTVLVVLHKLREVAAIAETVSVLRDGEMALGPVETATTPQGLISDAIIGEGHYESADVAGQAVATGVGRRTHLLMEEVSSKDSAFERGLKNVNLRIDGGETVGIAGVEGNGQRSLVSAVAGLTRIEGGSIRIGESEAAASSPARRRMLGLRLVPFDRNTEGVSRSASLWLNQSALRLIGRRQGDSPIISTRRYREHARKALERWKVRYESVTQPAGSLSGGNIQRLILSRELSDGTEVLVAAQPTRGLDFAATEFVRRSLGELRSAGAGILLVSSDLDELFELSDRLLVMLGGEVVARFVPPYDRRAVGDAMTGARR